MYRAFVRMRFPYSSFVSFRSFIRSCSVHFSYRSCEAFIRFSFVSFAFFVRLHLLLIVNLYDPGSVVLAGNKPDIYQFHTGYLYILLDKKYYPVEKFTNR